MRIITALWAFVLMTMLMSSCSREIDRQLVDAAAEGDSIKVARLISEGADIEAHEQDDWTPLTVAAREGHLDVVKILIKNGVKVNAKEGGGHTALFWAAKYKHQDIVNLLISENGINE